MLMFMMIEAYMGAPVDDKKDNATHIAEFKTGTAKPFWSDVRVPDGLEELCAANAVKWLLVRDRSFWGWPIGSPKCWEIGKVSWDFFVKRRTVLCDYFLIHASLTTNLRILITPHFLLLPPFQIRSGLWCVQMLVRISATPSVQLRFGSTPIGPHEMLWVSTVSCVSPLCV